ncbi:MAG: DUF5615 family PIN-like protein [Planctomycetes bacterium]|nr:DUF5615 family PIN-like protein [Planctomycetota bacterium]
MKCLVDEALPRSLAKALRDTGTEATDVRDVGLRGRPDSEIFAPCGRQPFGSYHPGYRLRGHPTGSD